jgi:hypothetical protein
VVAAIVAPVARFVQVRTVDWTPIEFPLPPDGTAREFLVEKSGTYELAIRIARPQAGSARDHAECLLGFDWVECSTADPPVTLRWTLHERGGPSVHCEGDRHDGRAVEGRSSGGRFTPITVERRLGCFDGREGTRYVLDVDASNLEGLEDLEPRFAVVASPALDREQHSRAAGVWVLSLLVGLAGFLLADRPV